MLQNDCQAVEKQLQTVRIDVNACGICGSDLALLRGKRSLKDERYFGHEFSGTVIDAGEEYNGITAGIRVASELSKTCGKCWNCRNGLSNYCRSMNDALLPGGFAEETLVLNTPDYSFLSPIPDTLDDITATLLEPANCSYHIATRAQMKPGDTVAVFGLGAIGLIAARILRYLGAGRVVGIDRNQTRIEEVRKTGIVDTVNSGDVDWQEQIREMCGECGPDIVVEATGAPTVFPDALRIVRPGGRVVAGSVYSGSIEQFEPIPIMRKELTVVGAKGPYPSLKTDGTSVVVDVVDRLQDDLKKIIKVYEYDEALRAFEDAASGAAVKAVIKFK